MGTKENKILYHRVHIHKADFFSQDVIFLKTLNIYYTLDSLLGFCIKFSDFQSKLLRQISTVITGSNWTKTLKRSLVGYLTIFLNKNKINPKSWILFRFFYCFYQNIIKLNSLKILVFFLFFHFIYFNFYLFQFIIYNFS